MKTTLEHDARAVNLIFACVDPHYVHYVVRKGSYLDTWINELTIGRKTEKILR